ncbi:MAG: kinase/pyrophosphorylase [Thermodesulfovibrionales bacterium]|nr:kinase/pyrophosphorylase [Thermodesulfovibrionales bacterium]
MKKSKGKKKIIYLVAESTGETINRIARASLVQFNPDSFEVKKFFMVQDKKLIKDIMHRAAEEGALVAFSIVEHDLRDVLIHEAEHSGIKAIDVIGDFIVQLSIFLNQKPASIPGRQYVLDEDYFKRIEAINFAVKHDDGKMPHGLKLADIVLVGLSRTGKTPLSTYLAHQGWKVANVPVHPDMDPPKELFEIDPKKVFGLVVSVESLVRLREGRLKQLGLAPRAKYADPVEISQEIDWCNEFFRQNPKWRIVDVSNRAIEEAAASIVRAYQTGKKPV